MDQLNFEIPFEASKYLKWSVIYLVVILHIVCMNVLKLCNKVFPFEASKYFKWCYLSSCYFAFTLYEYTEDV